MEKILSELGDTDPLLLTPEQLDDLLKRCGFDLGLSNPEDSLGSETSTTTATPSTAVLDPSLQRFLAEVDEYTAGLLRDAAEQDADKRWRLLMEQDILSLRELKKASPQLFATEHEVTTMLEHCCMHGLVDSTRWLMEECDASPGKSEFLVRHMLLLDQSPLDLLVLLLQGEEPMCPKGRDRLSCAIQGNHDSLISWMAEHGWDLNQLDSVQGFVTPVHEAILLKRPACLRALLESGAINPTVKSRCGFNPWHALVAAMSLVDRTSSTEDQSIFQAMAAILKEHHVDLEDVDDDLKTPLLLAGRMCCLEAIKLLLSMDANIQAECNGPDSGNILHMAVKNLSPEASDVVEFLCTLPVLYLQYISFNVF